MDKDLELLINNLTPEIDKKCEEIKTKRHENQSGIIFLLLCLLAPIIPTVLVFLGISIFYMIIPVAVTALMFLILSGIVLNETGGFSYE